MPALKNKTVYGVLAILSILYCYMESEGKGDFYIFSSAAYDLSSGADIFKKKYVDGYHYYYSVLFAVLLKPFCYLPFRAVKFLWQLLNLFLYFKMFRLMADSKPVQRLTEKQRLVFLAGVFIFSLRFLFGNISHSQITILILWCCVYGLYYIIHERPALGSLLLAIGINIKLLPIVLLPYLIYRGYFKATGFTVLFYGISLFLPAAFIGVSYNGELLASWLQLINPFNQTHVLDVDERSFHSLSTLLSTLLVEQVPDPYALPLKRNIADVSLTLLANILLCVRLFFIAFTLYFLKGKPFHKAASENVLLTEIAYLLLLIPLIFPHQQHYAFLFIVPAFSLVLSDLIYNYRSMSAVRRRTIIILLLIVYLSANLAMVLGVFNKYYEHYKILTYGALLLIPLLAQLSLKKQKSLPAALPDY